jgi:signal transduction histidine kinase
MKRLARAAPAAGAGASEAQGSTRARRGLASRLVLAGALLIAALGCVFGLLLFAIVELRDAAERARHSQQEVAAASQLQTLVGDVQTALRGYIITRDKGSLQQLENASSRFPETIKQLERLTGDDRAVAGELRAIKRSILHYREIVSPSLVVFLVRNPTTRQLVFDQDADRVQNIRGQLARFITREDTEAANRRADAEATAKRAFVAAGLGLALAALLILVYTLFLARRVARPVRGVADAARRLEAGDLSSRVETGDIGEIDELEQAFNRMASSLERQRGELEEQNQLLRESEQVKAELVNNVSHELRTPLASVLGFSDLLLRRNVPEENRRRYLELIRNETARLATLLNDLLDLQRIEQGVIDLERDELELNDLLVAQVALYSAQSQGHELDLEPSSDPLVVWGDRNRLAQVVGNLISNAIKYSPDGGRVAVEAARTGEEAEIAIADEGLGIPHEHQGQIFTKFFRGDAGKRLGIGGTGLGLVLARQIVEAHGGRIGFESEEGAGSRFWIRLPLLDGRAGDRVEPERERSVRRG